MDFILPIFMFLGIVFVVQVNIITWLFTERLYHKVKEEKAVENRSPVSGYATVFAMEDD
jgi:uncharacterized membrane protein YqiK|tara:strand:+ start:2500 stop:2676 length:177 start_codon:yes stop_codon:yes gene_type:complete